MVEIDLHERVLNELGSGIVSGRFTDGEVLKIDQVAEEMDVSRSVVREVVRVLESMRVLSSRRRVGVTVQPSTLWNPFDPRIIRWRLSGPDRLSQLKSLTQLRSGIEPVAAALAATQATPEQCADLTAAVMGMTATRRAGDLDAYLAHDITFHRVLLSASGNEMFASLGDVVAEVLHGRRSEHTIRPYPQPRGLRLHLDVTHAVQAGDSDGARAAMQAVLAEAADELSDGAN